jgi:hypothetical protein
MMADTALNRNDEDLAELVAQALVVALERKAVSAINREQERWQEYQRIYEGQLVRGGK